ncbi:MAG: hemolysin family protein [Deltaproteobacteria bacterium]|nr:hemolysin family protein [Deltaproteobacteria bacterium]
MDIVLAVVLCLVMEGLFTGAEMVLISADRTKLADRARHGDRGAEIALDLLSRPERTLATTLSGTNLFVVLSTVVLTAHFLRLFGEYAEWAAIGVATPLVILFGEIVPKSFSRPRAEALAGAAARFVRVAGYLLSPIVWVVSGSARLLSRPLGGVPPLRTAMTREEMRLMVQASQGRTDVEPHERTMVRRAFGFGEKKVGDIFRPLAQVVALSHDATCREAAEQAARSGYTRYPVYRERIDHVVGFVHVLDTVGHPPADPILPLLRKAAIVPELMPIDELLRKFQEAGTTFAVVVDEFGGVTGIVTAEDVVEEIVGEIEDEYDRRMEYYKKISTDEFLVPGRMEVSRFEEEFGVRLPGGDYATVGGMLTALAERIPAAGESFSVPGAVFTVEAASDRAVLSVRVRIVRDAGEGETADDRTD